VRLTRAQLDATRSAGHGLLEACPGSGKTRCLISKLLRAVTEVEDSARRVCCITYTNAAVAEIELRLRSTGYQRIDDSVDVSTIHSFCLNAVLRHAAHKIDWLAGGFTVLPSDAGEYQELVDQVAEEFGLAPGVSREIQYARRGIDGAPRSAAPDLPESAVIRFWDLLRDRRYLDFQGIIYYALSILRDHPRVAAAISARYAWILVDEFQDTDALQVELFGAIAAFKTSSFFLVGDPEQSIYGFAGATPSLVPRFADAIGAERLGTLRENFRSSIPIVRAANSLIGREPNMEAVGPHADCDVEPRLIRGVPYRDVILDEFIPRAENEGVERGSMAVLSPQWFSLLPIGRALRENGISVMGPGARPYRGHHLFARMAEELAAFVSAPIRPSIRRVERTLFDLIGELTGRWDFRVYTFEGRALCFELARRGREIRDETPSAEAWLASCAHEVGAALVRLGWVSTQQSERLTTSAADISHNIRRNHVDPAALTVDDLGIFAASSDSIRLLTLHSAKGREFDAVAIIDLVEGKIPHFRAESPDEIAEAARLLYVGVTRARKHLLLASDPRDPRDGPCRFLGPDYLNLV